MAGKRSSDRCRVGLVINERVVVAQLFAPPDRLHGVQVNAPVLMLVRLAIRLARVVDVAGSVTPRAAINHAAIGEAEEKGMVDGTALSIGTTLCLVPVNAFAPVFDDAFAGSDRPCRKDAFSMNGRRLDDVSARLVRRKRRWCT